MHFDAHSPEPSNTYLTYLFVLSFSVKRGTTYGNTFCLFQNRRNPKPILPAMGFKLSK